MRKNWFVDWHRAGWLQRFDKNGDEIMPYSKSSVKFVKISPEGMKFLSTSSTLDKYYVFSKGLDSLYSGTLEVVLDLLRNYSLDYVDLHEFTFFVTGISTPGSFSLSRSEAVELIREWRNITSLNRRMIDVHLSKQLVKSPKIKTKIKQRDYHNWINKTQQTFSLLQQSVYFELRNNSNFSHFDRLYLTGSNVEPGSEYSGKPKAKLSRNSQQKSEYFAKHGIKKHKGFELHHIVALTWAESDHEFKLFDNWQNLIYIDAFTHAKVSQSGNKHVRLVISGDGLALEAHDGERIELIEGENLIYSRALKNKMLTYNSRLNDSKVDKLIPKLKSDTGKAFSV